MKTTSRLFSKPAKTSYGTTGGEMDQAKKDQVKEESGWAVPIYVDRKELSAVLKSSGPGVPAEPGRDLAGKSVHNDSGDSAGRKPVFVGRVEEYSLDEGGPQF